ncbi:SprT-like domain-containing protein [Bacteroidota bacterium]
MKQYKEVLAKYVPPQAVDIIIEWMSTYKFQLNIKNNRLTKLGDYRPPSKYDFHRISINHNLNPYSFLITLVHEVAHLVVWENFKNNVKPHGKEWKQTYQLLMQQIDTTEFPADIREALDNYLKNPSASSTTHIQLSRTLNIYDKVTDAIFLENLPDKSTFQTLNGRTFKIKEKLRKRYKCICLNNNKLYLVHPLVKVIPIDH